MMSSGAESPGVWPWTAKNCRLRPLAPPHTPPAAPPQCTIRLQQVYGLRVGGGVGARLAPPPARPLTARARHYARRRWWRWPCGGAAALGARRAAAGPGRPRGGQVGAHLRPHAPLPEVQGQEGGPLLVSGAPTRRTCAQPAAADSCRLVAAAVTHAPGAPGVLQPHQCSRLPGAEEALARAQPPTATPLPLCPARARAARCACGGSPAGAASASRLSASTRCARATRRSCAGAPRA